MPAFDEDMNINVLILPKSKNKKQSFGYRVIKIERKLFILKPP